VYKLFYFGEKENANCHLRAAFSCRMESHQQLRGESVLVRFILSFNITGVIKSGKMTWLDHSVCPGQKRHIYRILVRKRTGKRPL